MKKLFFLGLLIGLLVLGRAQTFTTLPSNTVSAVLDPTRAGEYHFYFENVASSSITLRWDQVTATFPNNWIVQLCDNGECHNVPHLGDTMVTFVQGDSSFLKLTVIANNTPGIGTFCYHVWDTVSGDASDICFNIDATGTAVEPVMLRDRVLVTPTPATDVVRLVAKTGLLERGVVKVYDLAGEVVLSQEVIATRRNELNIKGLEDGIYLLRYETKSGSLTQKVVVAR
jgi:hypothetical protein